MRVAVISHACVVDVNQRLYEELARRDDIELLLIAPATWRASTGKRVGFRALPGAPYQTHPLPVWGSGQISLHWYRGLGPVLRRFDPDLIYLDEEPYSLPAWQTLRLARALHKPLAFVHTQNIVKRHPWPFRAVERAVLDYACLANPLTEECAEVLRVKNFGGRIVLIPHCVDTGLFHPQPQAELRERLGLDGFTVGYLGRLTEAKGVGDLMAAAERLWAAGLDFKLLVVGSGPLESRLREWSHTAGGRAVPTGAVAHDEAPRYLNAMDVLVMPSRTTPGWKEQFGRALIEALACGVPVIGSDSGNIPALLAETGGEGREPLLVLRDEADVRSAVLATDSLYRWELSAAADDTSRAAQAAPTHITSCQSRSHWLP